MSQESQPPDQPDRPEPPGPPDPAAPKPDPAAPPGGSRPTIDPPGPTAGTPPDPPPLPPPGPGSPPPSPPPTPSGPTPPPPGPPGPAGGATAPGPPGYPPPTPPGYAAAPAPPLADAYAIKRPVGRVIAFSILSFGIYGFYWFYVTRKQLNAEMRSGDDAGLYTAGLLVPILNVIITYWLWRDVDNLRRHVGLPSFNVVLWIVLAMFVPFAALVIYPMVVNRVNEYWDVRTQNRAVNARVGAGEKAIVAIGGLFWALWLLIAIVAILAASASSAVA
jgi:hypothetical protein